MKYTLSRVYGGHSENRDDNDPASHLEELGGVLLDGPEEPEALLLVVHDGPTGHTERERGRESVMIGL